MQVTWDHVLGVDMLRFSVVLEKKTLGCTVERMTETRCSPLLQLNTMMDACAFNDAHAWRMESFLLNKKGEQSHV